MGRMSRRKRERRKRKILFEQEQKKIERARRPKKRFVRVDMFVGTKTHAACRSCQSPCCQFMGIRVERHEIPQLMAKGLKLDYLVESTWKSRENRNRKVSKVWGDVLCGSGELLEADVPSIIEDVRVRRSVIGYRYIKIMAATRLKSREEGHCLYRAANGKCAIYSDRPLACRSWFCGRDEEDDCGIQPVWYRLKRLLEAKDVEKFEVPAVRVKAQVVCDDPVLQDGALSSGSTP